MYLVEHHDHGSVGVAGKVDSDEGVDPQGARRGHHVVLRVVQAQQVAQGESHGGSHVMQQCIVSSHGYIPGTELDVGKQSEESEVNVR